MAEFPIDDLPIAPNSGQLNMDNVGATINDMVRTKMGVLTDTGTVGRHFLAGEHSLFGYNGVVVRDGKIVSLLNLNGDEDIPSVTLGTEVTIVGNSQGYVSSGHKPGDKVIVVGFIEPFFNVQPGIQSSDNIIQVEGNGKVGWIKPSEFDMLLLKKAKDEEMQKLFEPTNK